MKNFLKKALAAAAAALMLLTCAAGCKKEKKMTDYGLFLYCEPEKDEEIAVMHTSCGDIYIRFFPDEAPLAVENFKTHAEEGYYDGLIFHRVIDGFMIQGGDPTGTGTGGESIWGSDFEDEFSPKARNFRGALSMANSGENTNGSQFFIVQAKTVSSGLISQMESLPRLFPKEVVEVYKKQGGTPWLDNAHTVFGFVFSGMETVDEIAQAKVDGSHRPLKDVTIDSVEIIPYSGTED